MTTTTTTTTRDDDAQKPPRIRPQRRNANRHTQRGMGMLEGSIERDGIIGALTVAADDEVFDGSARAETLPAMGFDLTDVAQVVKAEPGRVLIIESDGSSPLVHRRVDIPSADDPKAQRLGVAANRVAQVNLDFDPGVLAEVHDEAGLGALFFPDELKDLAQPSAPEPGGGGDDFDATPDDGPTRAQLGDLWVIGGVHRLLVGDCTDPANVARLMGGERADMVLTDPPYGMDLDTDWSDAVGQLTSTSRQHQTKGGTYERVIGDDEPFDPAHIFELFGYCKEMFLWGADYYAERIPERIKGSWLVWDKRKESQSEAIGAEFELCWSKAKHKRRMLRHDWFGFLSSSNPKEARNREHPTQKPTSLMIDIIQQWAKGDLVVDLYLGSGTTLIAAHRTGRRCYGCELSPRYADVILRRATAEGLTVERVETPMEA